MTLLALLLILIIAFLVWKRNGPQPASSYISDIPKSFAKPGIRSYIARFSPYCLWLSLAFIALAIIDPKLQISKKIEKRAPPRQGIALYYILDESGSMAESVSVGYNKISKIDLAKQALVTSLEDRQDDLVGLIGFARVARVLCPLTLDRSQIVKKLEQVTPLESDNVNGTAIGYAIFKAVNIFVATSHFTQRQKEKHLPVYTIESKAIVLITDGLQSPNPADRQNPFRFMPVDEALRYARLNKIKVFFIGVDPIFKRQEFAHDVQEIKAGAESTGGAFFITDQEFDINYVLSQINALQKSTIDLGVAYESYSSHSLMPFFIVCALILLAWTMLTETLLCRVMP